MPKSTLTATAPHPRRVPQTPTRPPARSAVSGRRARRLSTLRCYETEARSMCMPAGAWPALSTIAGLEAVADLAQIGALMKKHALAAQVFMISVADYVLMRAVVRWLRENLGETDMVTAGGGWYLAGPVTGEREQLLEAEIDLAQVASEC
ncbi:hypothetical protein BDDG_11735 [Blastomyces dermatitidis ATCC 18188]|uniref:Uncharacterized protein n=1 Tax=Ajellomyces dermatitidis (strain ATCC 18188 / CBS 674.68) TaxID=653446 RepID=A0A0J9ENF5_AJEDA|nr:hypothetical protein BDDG_11735 [Blastomyces dermatitidis ATCC 18188]